MQLEAEVIGKFEALGDCTKLLYVPPEGNLTYRRTKLYEIDFEGSEDAAKRFIDSVLVDHVSHDLHIGGEPALEGFAFCLDYGMKPTTLDHEKETILGYHRELDDPGFTFSGLKVTTRLYIFNADGTASADPFVRDIVNPAVHVWNVQATATR